MAYFAIGLIILGWCGLVLSVGTYGQLVGLGNIVMGVGLYIADYLREMKQ